MERERSPKEIKILDAAAALLNENKIAVSSLKVADIAQRAGIGKGTVYEYFSSKEEILQEAICRYLTYQINVVWEQASSQATFKESVYAMMEQMLNDRDCSTALDLQRAAFSDRESATYVFDYMRDFCRNHLFRMFHELADRGVAEGLFPAVPPDRVEQAFLQLLGGLGFLAEIGYRERYRQYMDGGYELLLRSLA